MCWCGVDGQEPGGLEAGGQEVHQHTAPAHHLVILLVYGLPPVVR